MVTVIQVLKILNEKADPAQLSGMAGFGMSIEKRLGISIPDLRAMAKKIGKDHRLANELWQTGIDDARILASMIDIPDVVTGKQMDDWVKDFNSWDVCDQVCMNLFDKAPDAWKKVNQWSEREEEYVKRAAYTLIACLAWHDKTARDERFIELLPLIVKGATDERNFVKKAVNWALRHIGKRNLNLNKIALGTAREISKLDSKAARWIASDAIRELESEAVRNRLQKNK